MLNLRARVAADSRERPGRRRLAVAWQAVRLLRESNPESPLLPIYLNNVAVNQMMMRDF